MPAYSKTNWVDGSVPAIDATNLNKMEQGIFDALRQDGSTTMSGQLVTTAGSAATPAIAPTGDSNTGIFFPAADTLSLGTAGGERIRINSSGNIGVGITDQSYKLDVAAYAATPLRVQRSGEYGEVLKIGRYGVSDGAGIGYPADNVFSIITNANERMRITSTGNVGVGDFASNPPPVQFSVSSLTGGVVGVTTKRGSGTNASPISMSYGFYGYLDGEKARITATDRSGNTNASDLNFQVKDSSDVLQSRLYISTAGNVGIGTTSPSVKFHIAGSTGVGMLIQDTTLSKTAYLTHETGKFQINANQAINFAESGTSTTMYLTGGNVGIGTTAPATRLHVEEALTGSGGGGIIAATASSNGNAGIGFRTASTDVYSITTLGSAGSQNLRIRDVVNNATRVTLDSNGYFLIGYTSSNGAYPLQVNGQIFATSSTIATSDGRYKKDLVALDGALDIVKALNPVQFSWKDHPVHKFNTDVPTVGFIAQEVEQALADKSYLMSIIKKSECTWETETGETIEREVTRDVEKQVTREVEREVTETIDGEEVTRTITEEVTETVIEQVTEIVQEPVKETHTEEFLGIAESNLIAILTKAVKELAAEVEALKAQLNK